MKSLRVRVWWLELGPLQIGGPTILRPGGFKGRKTRDLVIITQCDGDSKNNTVIYLPSDWNGPGKSDMPGHPCTHTHAYAAQMEMRVQGKLD
jgi:hypothetical protein